jgi:hypothetical protein
MNRYRLYQIVILFYGDPCIKWIEATVASHSPPPTHTPYGIKEGWLTRLGYDMLS